MKIAVIVIANDQSILRFFRKQRAAVVPANLRVNNTFEFKLFYTGCSNIGFMDEIIAIHKTYDASAILVESGFEKRFDPCSSAVFLHTFRPVDSKPLLQNFFTHNLARLLKNLIYLTRKFRDGGAKKCLLLPHQNFLAKDLLDLVDVCETSNDASSFPTSVDTLVAALRKRSVPKKLKSGNSHFLVDDRDLYFELAKEQHGQCDTKIPPHKVECELNGTARFGVSISRLQHYNVSVKKAKISGTFEGCHLDKIDVSPATHLNIFPNGFIR